MIFFFSFIASSLFVYWRLSQPKFSEIIPTQGQFAVSATLITIALVVAFSINHLILFTWNYYAL